MPPPWAMFMPMKPVKAPPAFFAASCMAWACAPTRCAAAMLGLRKVALRCSSLIMASSSSEALTEFTPKDTISTPRRFAHFSDSTSLSASAISMVCPGRLL